MSQIDDLKMRCLSLKLELQKIEEQIKSLREQRLTKTGKIECLINNKEYFLIGMKGQIYSRRLRPGLEEQFIYLNNLRRLFLTEQDAAKQRQHDESCVLTMDRIDREER